MSRYSKWIPIVCTLTTLGYAPSALPAGEMIEEIIVTAQRREENLQDTPISVTAFSGDAIEVVSGNSSAAEVENMANLSNTFKLAASTGSDFHGSDKPWT